MPSQIDGRKVGFVGAGAMAEALARGFLDKNVIEAGDIWSCDPSKARMDVFAEFGCSNVKNAAEVRASRLCYSRSLGLQPHDGGRLPLCSSCIHL